MINAVFRPIEEWPGEPDCRVIFLDVDGVLLTEWSYKNPVSQSQHMSRKRAPQSCVNALNRLLAESSAKVVISSTWRMDGLAKMREHLAGWGVMIGERGGEAKIIGCTPRLEQRREIEGRAYYVSAARGTEIQAWLDEAPLAVQAIVILDDEADMEHLTPYLVQTNFSDGLTEAHVDLALGVLARGDVYPEKIAQPLRLKILAGLVVLDGAATWDDLAELVAAMSRDGEERCPRASVLRETIDELIEGRLMWRKPNGMWAITPAGLEVVKDG
jgi:hypothetical protein